MIDIHAHLWNGPRYLDRFVEKCHRVGIKKVCVSACGPLYNQPGNKEVKKALTKHPDLVVGFGYVRLGNDKADMVDKLYQDGFKGVKVINPTKNYEDKDFYPIYERAQERNMPVLFHTGIVALHAKDGEHNVSSARMRPIYLDAIARAFPKLTIIGAHLGVPWHEEAGMLMRVHPNVYFDLTGSVRHGWRSTKTTEFFRNLFHWPGAFDKVLFGTDVKIDDMEAAVDIYHRMLDPLKLPKDVLDNIYSKTAARLLGFVTPNK